MLYHNRAESAHDLNECGRRLEREPKRPSVRLLGATKRKQSLAMIAQVRWGVADRASLPRA
jgi:hypothetical protein